MNEENMNKLFNRFSFLREENVPGGIQCGDGWNDLILEMFSVIEATNPPDSFVVTHVAERYRKLDVRTKGGTMKTRVIINEFADRAFDVCHECGNDHSLEACEVCKVPEIDYSDEEEEQTDGEIAQR